MCSLTPQTAPRQIRVHGFKHMQLQFSLKTYLRMPAHICIEARNVSTYTQTHIHVYAQLKTHTQMHKVGVFSPTRFQYSLWVNLSGNLQSGQIII